MEALKNIENVGSKDFIVLLNKPKGITSFKAINMLKRELGVKKTGHAGTLDPMAEGLLIVMVNGATKFSDELMKKDKTYYVEMEFSYLTDTLDTEGKIIEEIEKEEAFSRLKDKDIKKYLEKFIGKIKQIPPMYSAIKKDGVKMYDLARKGINLELEPRNVEIYNIEDIKLDGLVLSFRTKVSSGTYIRSLVRDIGNELNCPSTMTKLVRESINKFELKNIDQLVQNVIDIENLFEYEKLHVDDGKYFALKNGMTVLIEGDSSQKKSENQRLKVYNKEKFIGIVEILRFSGYNYYIKKHKYLI